MAGQTRFGQITDADFASLLQALSGSAKGRAFLDELRRRSRPEETGALLHSLQRIERTIAGIRDQLQPDRIADELRHVAMTLEIAADGLPADAEGDDASRRMALVNRARSELAALAAGLDGEAAPALREAEDMAPPDEPEIPTNALAFLDQSAEADTPPAER